MNIHLEHLVKLSNINKEIDSFEPRIEKVKSEINIILNKKEELSKNSMEIEDGIKNAQLDIQKNELHLEGLSSKLEDISKKHKVIKTEKELKALNLEEDIAKEQITHANEEIEKLDRLKENRAEELKEIAKEIAKLDEDIKKIEDSVNDELKTIENERKSVFDRKEKLISTMDQKIIMYYEKIRRWAENTTVVPLRLVASGNNFIAACGGCFLKLNNKTFDAIKKGDEIITCPHCGRILYYDPPKEES